ncbi:MAG TPA: DUF2510 domain-containing protein [Acidimicrobiales bacterium]|nr:DUF2510 domain-containing protein [Acidimicrobiales bacterium]
MSDAPAPKAAAGWYPDPWTPTRRRYWNGSSWTFSTTDEAALGDPPPADAAPLPPGHGLPDPVPRQPVAAAGPPAAPAKPKQNPVKWAAAVVVGLLVGMAGIALSTRSSDDPETAVGPAPTAQPSPSVTLSPPTSAPSSPAGNDPSAPALESLVVQPEDVPASARVVVFPGGIGLNQPTLDLCHGRYPSESRRTARIQDAVLDAQGLLVLSTEAVLYGDSAATTQAFSELRSVTAECPPTPVQGPTGQATTTTFNPAPDSNWSQTPTVNRLAYDVTITEPATPPRRLVAVYLQRGRALLGVYFSQPESDAQVAVEGKTTIEEIVAVFAARLAALPTSVVGS